MTRLPGRNPAVRVTFDRSANAAYIYLRKIGWRGVVESFPVDDAPARGDIILDFDAEGRLIGIEVLNAREALPEDLLNRASPP